MNPTVSLSLITLAFAACGPSTQPIPASTSAAVRTTIAPAHLACTTDPQYPLELLTQTSGAIQALYGDAVLLTGTLKSGKADLGQFLSGEYSVKLSSAVERGESGKVSLYDDEGPDNGGTTTTAYTCATVAPVVSAYTCTPTDPSQYPLSFSVDASANVTVDYAGDAVSWTSALHGGNALLGQFLSGQYSIVLDLDVLDGNATGTATLSDDEGGNGGSSTTTYDCTTSTTRA